jgi:hypothetical protein
MMTPTSRDSGSCLYDDAKIFGKHDDFEIRKYGYVGAEEATIRGTHRKVSAVKDDLKEILAITEEIGASL